MFDTVAIMLFAALAVLLNAYAARASDREGARRAEKEAGWSGMIAAAMAGD